MAPGLIPHRGRSVPPLLKIPRTGQSPRALSRIPSGTSPAHPRGGNDEYPADQADRGRHSGFARHEGLAGGPGSLSLSFTKRLCRRGNAVVCYRITNMCRALISASRLPLGRSLQKRPPFFSRPGSVSCGDSRVIPAHRQRRVIPALGAAARLRRRRRLVAAAAARPAPVRISHSK